MRCHVCVVVVFFGVAIDPMDRDTALLLADVCGREKGGSEGGVKLRADAAGLEFSHKLV